MLTVDIQLPDVEELQKLVEIGLERGFVTYDEVSSVVDEVELTKEQVEDFYAYLFEHGVGLADAEGNLVTRTGLTVLGDGGPIQVPRDETASIAPDGTWTYFEAGD